MKRSSPPKLATALIARAVPSDKARAGVLGDLHEEFADRLDSAPRLVCAAWYWRQALLLLVRYRLGRHRPGIETDRKQEKRRMEDIAQDVRYGVRGLLRSPGFSVTALLVPALAIAANAAVFSLVNAAFLSPLPYPEAGRLATVWNLNANGERDSISPADLIDWRQRNRVFGSLAGFQEDSFNLTRVGDPVRLQGYRVSAGFFELLGIAPLMGRGFSPEEDRHGAQPVAILSYGLWQGRFGARQDALGKTISLNGSPHTVVGVMPPEFRFPSGGAQLWVPLSLSPRQQRQRRSFYLNAVARLGTGISLERADREMKAIAVQLREELSNTHDQAVTVVPLRESMTGDLKPIVLVLQGGVGLVLLAACANIANLFLARSLSRRREIATRMALGAGRLRIARQLLTESLLLGVGGGILGLALVFSALPLLTSLLPFDLSWAAGIEIDYRVLLFTLLASLAAGLFFGLVPALQISRWRLGSFLAGGKQGRSLDSRGLVRNALVLGEVALALLLLVAAGLFLRSVVHLSGLELGFQAQGLTTMRMDLPESRYPNGPQRWQFYQSALDRIGSLPGVESLGFTAGLPMTLSGGALGFTPEGSTRSPGDDPIYAAFRGISADYLQCMRIPLQSGRYFEEDDFQPGRAVMVINQAMAARFWPGQDPVGRRMKLFGPSSNTPWATIVGVVGDVRRFELQSAPPATFYAPYTQVPITHFTPRDLVVRNASPGETVRAVIAGLREIDPDLPIYQAGTMEAVVSEGLSRPRASLVVFSIFGGLTCLLAAVGVYGVISFSVGRRGAEFGLRMALGAAPGKILGGVLRQAALLASVGGVCGILLSVGSTRVLSGWLYGVTPTDGLTLAAASVLVFATVMTASFVPALRATRVDPATALRRE